MPKRLRLTRRFPVALSDTAYRALARLAGASDLTKDETLTFLFENIGTVTDQTRLTHRIRRFRAELDDNRT